MPRSVVQRMKIGKRQHYPVHNQSSSAAIGRLIMSPAQVRYLSWQGYVRWLAQPLTYTRGSIDDVASERITEVVT